MTWVVEFYEEEDGSAPVEEFLAKLPKQHRDKSLQIVKLLEEAGRLWLSLTPPTSRVRSGS